MAAKDLALSMLAQGLQPSVVASTIGVQESYISQLMADEDFAAAVEAARVEATQEDLEYDEKLNKVEHTYLDRIEAKAPAANLQQSMQAFKILNAAKRRKDRSQQPAMINHGTIVNISLPTAIIPQYITNGNNEIVEVEGQTMISATPKNLDGMLQKRKPPAALELEQKLENDKKERAIETLDSVRPVSRQRKLKDAFSVDML